MSEEVISEQEAARILEVQVSYLRKLARAGTLRPHPPAKSMRKPYTFRLSDVVAFKEMRSSKITPAVLLAMARQSILETRAIRRELDHLRHYLNINIAPLSTEREELVACLLKAEDAFKEAPIPDREELLYWARTFHALSHAHFQALALYTKTKEPWRSFLRLATHLIKSQPVHLTHTDLELKNIYVLLNAGYICMRQAAYFYVREENGVYLASRMFPETQGNIHEDVISLSFIGLPSEYA